MVVICSLMRLLQADLAPRSICKVSVSIRPDSAISAIRIGPYSQHHAVRGVIQG